MSDPESPNSEEIQIVAGMMSSETPQQRAERLIELLERGEVDEARAITAARAARTAAAFAKELASLESE